MNIQFEQTGSKGAFFIQEDNQRLAEMTFSMAGENLMIIDHTGVSDALRGKGAGKQLVEAAVEHARKNSIKIMPLCPFAKSMFDKITKYQDVLDS
ncbi:GNAT family N-acetyltransferase [Oscillatoria amoena NRMC-F 0135]|nr:GNAT family N-acetyltransferase [Oscillatoria amoena NRMC-F 0135]